MSIRSIGVGRCRPVATALFTALLLLVPVSVASADCPALETTQAFSEFGDSHEYAAIPGGSFENGTTSGWTFITSRIAAGNDGYDILPGVRSLQLGGGIAAAAATAISPPFCVDATHPYFRFMFRPMAAAGALATFILYRDVTGHLITQLVGSKINTTLLPGYWRLSQLNPLSINIPLLEAGGTATVQLAFVSPLSINGPSYYVDDILVDPYRRG